MIRRRKLRPSCQAQIQRLFLWKQREVFDHAAHASAEIGFLFTSLVLVTGSIWARPIWGTWWSWDARLTTTLIHWFIYGAYLTLRGLTTDDHQSARYAAAVGIVGFLVIPIIHQSVVWWRTLHLDADTPTSCTSALSKFFR